MALSINQVINNTAQGQKMHFTSSYSATYIRQISPNIRHWMISYWRQVSYNLTRIVVVALCSCLFGLSVVDQRICETHDQTQLQAFNGAIFAAIFFTCAIQAARPVESWREPDGEFNALASHQVDCVGLLVGYH
eukprot:377520-Rhodomonas_salina.2